MSPEEDKPTPKKAKKKRKKAAKKKQAKRVRTTLPATKKKKKKKKTTAKKTSSRKSTKKSARRQTAAPAEPTQEQVAQARVEPPPTSSPYIDHGGDLPADFGDDRIQALVRDPAWIFVYWELHGEYSNHVVQAYGGGQGFTELPWHLRVHSTQGDLQQEIPIYVGANNWYVQGAPLSKIVIEIGFYAPDGNFVVATSTGTVELPRGEPSPDRHETWMQRPPEQRLAPGAKGFSLVAAETPEGEAIDITDARARPPWAADSFLSSMALARREKKG